MQCTLLIFVLLSSFTLGQALPPQPAGAPAVAQTPATPRHDDDDEPPPASASTVSQETPVITIDGLCDRKTPIAKSADATSAPGTAKAEPREEKSENSSSASSTSACRTVITRAQFDKLTDSLNPQMPAAVKRQLAEAYPRLLLFADKARELGLDKDPSFSEMMQFASLQLLSQIFTRHLQQKASEVSDAEIEKYYNENSLKFQRAELLRILIPRQKRHAADPGSGAQPQLAADDAAMKAEAERVHKAAVAGKDFQQLQKEAFDAAGITSSSSPNANLGKMSPSGLPLNHRDVFALQPGQVSELFTDPNGYYIYKVVSKQMVPLSQAKTEIRNTIQSQRMQDSTESLVKTIKSELNQAYFGASRSGPSAPAQPSGRQSIPEVK
jgi:parvulin-like peptidyl-prolyl isomerase